MYTLVAPFDNSFDDIGLIYTIPDFLRQKIKIGMIVEIPLQNKNALGVVLKIDENKNLEIDAKKIKSIISIKSERNYLPKYQGNIISWMASNYIIKIHHVANIFFPKNLKEKLNKQTIEKDFKKQEHRLEYKTKINTQLTPIQEKIYQEIQKSENKKILLFGVTGSGKTEIYLKLIDQCIQENKQALILVPEIILTNQIAEKIVHFFGENVLQINSTVAQAKKTKAWIDIYNNNAKVIIGTRSALFYPFSNLGLIIVDEEHDNSYISDSSPRYNAIEVASKITDINKNMLILGSGTPSIKSMYKAIQNEYKLLHLLEKYNPNTQR